MNFLEIYLDKLKSPIYTMHLQIKSKKQHILPQHHARKSKQYQKNVSFWENSCWREFWKIQLILVILANILSEVFQKYVILKATINKFPRCVFLINVVIIHSIIVWQLVETAEIIKFNICFKAHGPLFTCLYFWRYLGMSKSKAPLT